MSVDPTSIFDVTIGAGLGGLAVSLLLYGITTGQVILYLRRHTRGLWARCYVCALWIIDTMHTMFIAATMFYDVVEFHAEPANFTRVLWTFGTMVIVSETSNMLVRLGYAYRIWKYNNRRIKIPVTVITITTVLFIMSCVFGALELTFQSLASLESLEAPFFVACGLQIFTDGLIAVRMLVLCTRFFTGMKRFDATVQVIILYLVNTGLLSAVLSTVTIILLARLPGTYFFLATYWVLVKLHICSLLGILNAEGDLMDRTSRHMKRNTPVLLTSAVHIDSDDVLTGPGPSQLGVELTRLASSSRDSLASHLIAEVPRSRKSYESREQSTDYAM